MQQNIITFKIGKKEVLTTQLIYIIPIIIMQYDLMVDDFSLLPNIILKFYVDYSSWSLLFVGYYT